jgi:hypothetical protein
MDKFETGDCSAPPRLPAIVDALRHCFVDNKTNNPRHRKLYGTDRGGPTPVSPAEFRNRRYTGFEKYDDWFL